MALADKMQIPALTVIARCIPIPSTTWVRTDRSGILFPTRRRLLQGSCPDAWHALLSKQTFTETSHGAARRSRHIG